MHPGHLVADLCAAPGSKTLQLLDALSSEGLLVANDDHWQRSASALRRCQAPPLLWLVGDARELPTLHDHSDGRVKGARKVRFDRVLCDVPCSGRPGHWGMAAAVFVATNGIGHGYTVIPSLSYYVH